ncbi:MAG: hypothetical protein EYC69_09750 [Bacteroidetes bacterium]|nr:MAG: hypothetical protein EYC69_09750 [Bacteroidota bacterium]
MDTLVPVVFSQDSNICAIGTPDFNGYYMYNIYGVKVHEEVIQAEQLFLANDSSYVTYSRNFSENGMAQGTTLKFYDKFGNSVLVDLMFNNEAFVSYLSNGNMFIISNKDGYNSWSRCGLARFVILDDHYQPIVNKIVAYRSEYVIPPSYDEERLEYTLPIKLIDGIVKYRIYDKNFDFLFERE